MNPSSPLPKIDVFGYIELVISHGHWTNSCESVITTHGHEITVSCSKQNVELFHHNFHILRIPCSENHHCKLWSPVLSDTALAVHNIVSFNVMHIMFCSLHACLPKKPISLLSMPPKETYLSSLHTFHRNQSLFPPCLPKKPTPCLPKNYAISCSKY